MLQDHRHRLSLELRRKLPSFTPHLQHLRRLYSLIFGVHQTGVRPLAQPGRPCGHVAKRADASRILKRHARSSRRTGRLDGRKAKNCSKHGPVSVFTYSGLPVPEFVPPVDLRPDSPEPHRRPPASRQRSVRASAAPFSARVQLTWSRGRAGVRGWRSGRHPPPDEPCHPARRRAAPSLQTRRAIPTRTSSPPNPVKTYTPELCLASRRT